MRGFNYKKAIQALNYLAIRSGGRLNKMKAIKLIWLSDRYNIRKSGRTITGDVYFALKFGPVASCTRDILENNSLSDNELEYKRQFIEVIDQYNYVSIGEFNPKVFSQKELEVIQLMYDTYGHLTQFEISELSHIFPEWKKYEAALKSTFGSSRFEIDTKMFFENSNDGFHLFSNSEEEIQDMLEYHNELLSFSTAI